MSPMKGYISDPKNQSTQPVHVKNHWSIHKQIKLNGIIEASYGVKGFIQSLAGNNHI